MNTFSILVADDEISNLEVILEYLKDSKEQFRIIQASDGEKACKVAKMKSPDLIIMDWEMPVMTGYEALLHLKESPDTKDIPVVMATAQQSSEYLEKAMNAGAVDYVKKPIDKVELLARIRSALELSQSYRKIKHQKLEIEKKNRRLEEQQKEIIEQNDEREQRNRQLSKQKEKLIEAYSSLDMTLKKLKNTQVKLVQSEKMASLGQLTAGIAHEINNPINYIFGGTDALEINFQELLFVLRKYDELNTAEHSDFFSEVNEIKENIAYKDLLKDIPVLLRDIRSGAERTAVIINGLKNFSRLDEKELKPADIHDGLDSAWMLLQSSLKKDIKMVKNYDRTIGSIAAYHGDLNQVFMNLLTNAVQAIKTKGIIKITTQGFEDYISISIQDNGKGIKNEHQDKVFDPFFTTQEVGDGRGLGLSISYTVVDKHNGMIKVQSTEDEGSNFVVTLPRT